ncbi:MAG: endonuclease domain-containing protein [Deltaproteobacteria bacterium]|nr:endonuclease domain-containing protein [Deltaproteobacteria bacterium]
MTDAEKKLWAGLRRRALDGARFRRQFPVGPFIADFACRERWLVVEVDGGQHAEHTAEDAQRTAWLERHGYRVLRFWNHEVLNNLEGVLLVVAEDLRNHPHHRRAGAGRPRKGGG